MTTTTNQENLMTQTPTVGRIVHYVSHGSPVLPDGSQKYAPQVRAAIVTAVTHSEGPSGEVVTAVSLAVLNPTGLFFDPAVPYAEPSTPNEPIVGGSWHWPPRG